MKLYMKRAKGFVLLYGLFGMAICLLLLGGLFTYLNVQTKVLEYQVNQTLALTIAEAGIDRFEWQLAHDPDEFILGTGEQTYGDPLSGTLGAWDTEVIPPEEGSSLITIRATGWSEKNSDAKRTIEVQYGKPSLAEYSFLTNSDVWFGDDEHLIGKMHSNGGIRMDGTCNSVMSSAKETYNCQEHHGCGGGQEKPGIWGDADVSCSSLWEFPVPAYDFDALNELLSDLRDDAGMVLPDSGAFGYHIVFQADGTFDLYQVTRLRAPSVAFDTYGVRRNGSYDISSEQFIERRSLPANGLIVVEDWLWVEGTFRGRATIAAGIEPYQPDTAPLIMISNNLVYSTKDGSDSLALIGQRDVMIPRYVPDTM
ncbi:MAG: hypothetical protein HYZ08_02425, partial [Candidatus Kerfeldbacteria bacterium]|nr:hypothetical protein [Candidatus Kerfeldbacteria bacterium]